MSPEGIGPSGETLTSIKVVPASATLTLNQSKIDSKTFKALGFYSGATDKGVDITDKVTWKLGNPLLGRLVGSTFRTEVLSGGKAAVAEQGGSTTVTASLKEVSGVGSLKVILKRKLISPGAPADADKRFGGPAAPNRAPSVLYPLDGVLVPPNLRQMEVQWTKGAGNGLFEVSFTGALCDVKVYTTAASFNLSSALWRAVAWTSREEEVKVRVRGTAAGGGAGKGVGSSKAVSLRFGKMDVRGGIYFWVVSDKDGEIHRYDFTKAQAKTEIFMGPKQGQGCVGCHSLSRNGKRIAFTMGESGTAAVFDVANRKSVISAKFAANFYAFSPDGKQIVSTMLGALDRREVETGKVFIRLELPNKVITHPDWSPDGKTVAFTMTQRHGSVDAVHPTNGSIATVGLDSAGEWLKEKVLVQSGGGVNNYYPSFSPCGEWILFNRSTGDAYSDEDANLLVVSVKGGKPIPLGKINGVKQSNSWGRWSPFTQAYKGGVIYWLTFSSVRDYGFMLKNSEATLYGNKAPQIWMAGFSRTEALKGLDPSFAPFWLPIQSTSKHNHIAQWTTKVIDLK